MYEKFFKRLIDFLLSLFAVLFLSPLLLLLTLTGAIAMRGNPFFCQVRPGLIDRKSGREKLFSLIKFRSMTRMRDREGNLMPDEKRLNAYGRFLRAASLDELPSLLLCLTGKLALVGPRPQLVRDMVFMTPDQRRRHSVRPGLTGLAQCNGRNHITWERKFEYDLEYIDRGISFWGDFKIICKTVLKVFAREGISQVGMATGYDFGEHLLMEGKVTQAEFDEKQAEAKALLAAYERGERS